MNIEQNPVEYLKLKINLKMEVLERKMDHLVQLLKELGEDCSVGGVDVNKITLPI